ncbi:hypothetical protein pYptb0032 (plasmid) [Yersinia pseudotuberculosis IP 32953]|uniref:Uncharacterized protein n=1 Tax=Yersinia pseudotuberculosis serotype I (strain IP32953) TaxID=273123 RepID=Q663C3_YERPS|nr:hypothetical protein pYptb0032 [Yersinia pseudotuberculosis IP 32953]
MHRHQGRSRSRGWLVGLPASLAFSHVHLCITYIGFASRNFLVIELKIKYC